MVSDDDHESTHEQHMYIICTSHVYHMYITCTVESLLTDIPNSGHLPNNEQEPMHQQYFPLLQYKTHLPRTDTSLLRTTDSYACTNNNSHLLTDSVRSLVLTTPISRRIITELACNNWNKRRTRAAASFLYYLYQRSRALAKHFSSWRTLATQ